MTLLQNIRKWRKNGIPQRMEAGSRQMLHLILISEYGGFVRIVNDLGEIVFISR